MTLSFDQKLLGQEFLKLPQPENKVQCQYVWIDGSLRNFRTKSKTWPTKPSTAEDLPVMEFCGSATDFDVGNLADYYSKPVKLFQDPFRCGHNRLVLCETYSRERLPTFANNRYRLLAAENSSPPSVQRYAFHQSYQLLRQDGRLLSYMQPAYLPESKAEFSCGRAIAEAHYRACLYAGVELASSEAVTPHGQWRYSVGASSGVDLGDHVWMSRFILLRVAEDFGVAVTFEKADYGLTSSFELDAGDVVLNDRQRISDALVSKFVIKEHRPVKVRSARDNILISELNAEIDPYFFCNKVLEVLSDVK